MKKNKCPTCGQQAHFEGESFTKDCGWVGGAFNEGVEAAMDHMRKRRGHFVSNAACDDLWAEVNALKKK